MLDISFLKKFNFKLQADKMKGILLKDSFYSQIKG